MAFLMAYASMATLMALCEGHKAMKSKNPLAQSPRHSSRHSPFLVGTGVAYNEA